MISCSHFDYKRFVKFQIRENLDYQSNVKFIYRGGVGMLVGQIFLHITKRCGIFLCNGHLGESASFIGVVEIFIMHVRTITRRMLE